MIQNEILFLDNFVHCPESEENFWTVWKLQEKVQGIHRIDFIQVGDPIIISIYLFIHTFEACLNCRENYFLRLDCPYNCFNFPSIQNDTVYGTTFYHEVGAYWTHEEYSMIWFFHSSMKTFLVLQDSNVCEAAKHAGVVGYGRTVKFTSQRNFTGPFVGTINNRVVSYEK